MKLKKVIPTRTKSSGPFISMNGKGMCYINPAAAELMGIKKLTTPSMDFYQDEEEPGDWYIRPSNEGSVRLGGKGVSYHASICSVSRAIKKSNFHNPAITLRCEISKAESGYLKLEIPIGSFVEKESKEPYKFNKK